MKRILTIIFAILLSVISTFPVKAEESINYEDSVEDIAEFENEDDSILDSNAFDNENILIDSFNDGNEEYIDVENTNNSNTSSIEETTNVVDVSEDNEIKEKLENSNDNQEVDINDNSYNLNYIDPNIDTSKLLHSNSKPLLQKNTFPSQFSLIDKRKVTSVKNQGEYGTCWAFGSIASAESTYMIENDFFDDYPDLSELHLAYYAYHNRYKADKLKLITNDGSDVAGQPNLQEGGNYYVSTMTLASGLGMVFDYMVPYSLTTSFELDDTNDVNCYDSNFRLKEAKWYNMSEKDVIKEKLMEYGAIGISYYHSSSNFNTYSNAYYNRTISSTNHAVTLVGWDDNYSRKNFNTYPTSNGAWLVKNSWGDVWGDNGYFWISYEDASLKNGFAAQFFIEDSSEINSIYQYDGSGSTLDVTLNTDEVYQANIFTTYKREYLYKVGFFTENTNVEYEIFIYKDLNNGSKPNSGTLVSSAEGVVEDSGYHTVYLDRIVELPKGTKFSIVVKQKDKDGDSLYFWVDKAYYDSYIFYSDYKTGQSFVSKDMNTWTDTGSSYNDGYNVRIKGITLSEPFDLYEVPTLKVGEQGYTNTSYYFKDRNITYDSSNKKVATIDENGIITALSYGQTIISATIDDIKDSFLLTVPKPKDYPNDLAISIDSNTGDITIKTSSISYLQSLFNETTYTGVVFEKNGHKVVINTETAKGCISLDTKNKQLTLYSSIYKYLEDGTYNVSLFAIDYNSYVISDSYIVYKVLPDVINVFTEDGFLYVESDSNYINSISRIGIGNSIFDIKNNDIQSNKIVFDCSKLYDTGLRSDSYDIALYSDSYYTKVIYSQFIEIENKKTGNVEITFNNGIEISSDDNIYLNSLLDNRSVITFSYENESYTLNKNGLDINTKDSRYYISIPMSKIKELLPGVNNRQYTISLSAYGFGYTDYLLTIDGLSNKENDFIYVYVNYDGGELNGETSFITKVKRNNKINDLFEPNKYNYIFDGWFNLNGESFQLDSYINTNDDVYLIAHWTPANETSKPYTSISTDNPIEKGTYISLHCNTKDSIIKYTINGSNPKENGAIYSDEIYIDHDLTIKAYAYADGKKDSEIVDFSYSIIDNDYGDITDEDKDKYISNPINGLWMSNIPESVEYTGKAITLDFRIYDGIKLLKQNIDYTVSYKNNTKVGEALITINGKGSYSGTLIKSFNIVPINISEARADDLLFTYNYKKIQKGEPIVFYIDSNGIEIKLKKNTDYTLTYDPLCNYLDPGEYVIHVLGKGNYTGEYLVNESIVEGTLVKDLKITVSNCDYTGSPVIPNLIIKNGSTVLDSSLFDIEYENNTEIGDAKVTIKGKNGYYGTKELNFEINGIDISKTEIEGIKDYNFSGSEIYQENLNIYTTINKQRIDLIENEDYELSYDNNIDAGTASVTIKGINGYFGSITKKFKINGVNFSEKDGVIVYGFLQNRPYSGEEVLQNITVKYKGEQLVLNQDYVVNYSNNINASKNKAILNIVGAGKYIGTIKKTFSIDSINIETLTIDSIEAQQYSKNGATPLVNIHDINGNALQLGIDYTLSYEKNKSVSSIKNIPALTIKCKGNYVGSKKITFEINQTDIENCSINADDVIFKDKAGNFKTKITISDNGSALKAKTDYEDNFIYRYAEAVVLADGQVKAEGSIVDDNDIVPVNSLLSVSVSGKGYYTGQIVGTFRIIENSISSGKVSISNQYYNGKEIRLSKKDIDITIGKNKLSTNDFEIVSYSNNINPGKASVVIKGIGKYGGMKTANFTIVSKNMNSSIIVYCGNGSTKGTMKNSNTTDNKIYLSNNVFEKNGYTFLGWTDNIYSDEVKYLNCSEYSLNENEFGVYKLYALWQKNDYTITYDYDGGSEVYNPTHYSVDTQTIKLAIPTKNGYTFTGWYNNNKKIESIVLGSTGDLCLIAKWKIDKYTIKTNLNGGKIINGKIPSTYSIKDFINLPMAIKQGYKFVGWYKSDGTKVNSINYGGHENLVLNAKWTPITYFVNFDMNGIPDAYLSSMSLKYGYKYRINAFDYYKDGLEFVGWNTQADGKGKTFSNGSDLYNLSVNDNETITLYAQWSLNNVDSIYYSKIGYDRTNIWWIKSDNVDYYRIYRSKSKTGKYELIDEIDASKFDENEFVDYFDFHNLTAKTTYYYKVTSVKVINNKSIESDYTKQVEAKTALKPNFEIFLDKWSDWNYHGLNDTDLYPKLYTKNKGEQILYLHNPILVNTDGITDLLTCYIYDRYSGENRNTSWSYYCTPDKKWYYNLYYTHIDDYRIVEYGGYAIFTFTYDGIEYRGYCDVGNDGYRAQDMLIGYEYIYNYSNR